MKPDIEQALGEIRAVFPDATVTNLVNGDGSVFVTVDPVHLGDQWVPTHSPISFTIPAQYPYAECYPHFVDNTLARKDGTALGEAVHANSTTPQGQAAVMISRRNGRFTAVPDTAADKLIKVIAFMRSR